MLVETNLKGTAIIIGRFQPITIAHYNIINNARIKYQQIYIIVVDPSYKTVKKRKARVNENPFNLKLRIDLIYKAFDGKIDFSHIISAPNAYIPDVINKIMRYSSKNKNKEKIVLFAGSDRVESYKRSIINYSKEKNIDIEVLEVPREINSAENISATKVREALRNNDRATFNKLTPAGIHSEYDKLRSIISESKIKLFSKLINEMILQEGGLGGHILHPSDDMSKSEFIKFFDDFLNGKISATEKVDGYNLFVGYDDKGNIVAARNKTEIPFTDINQRFRKSHGGRTAFLAGFKAIKSGLEKLSLKDRIKYKLVDEQNHPINFINLEIIYGSQPNIVPYSKSKNYIVFHYLSGTKENGYVPQNLEGVNVKNILTRLANKLKTTATVQSEPSYSVGTQIVRKFTPKKSYWEFKGPLKFDKNQLKKILSDPKIKSIWEKRKKDLLSSNKQGDELRDQMKKIALEIGSFILRGVKSKLSDIPTADNQPGSEGLVVNYNGKLYKITGDFGSIYTNIERPPDFLSDLKTLIGQKILKIKLRKIDKRNVEKYGNLSKLLQTRNPSFDYDKDLEESDKISVINAINKAYKDINNYINLKNDNRDITAKSFKSLLYDLQEFKKDIDKAKTYKDLARAFFEDIFWQKSKLSENLLSRIIKELI